MVRVFIKGGIWKNSEDEILKAAIMKYGKQQWARVASLLNRKSAKQCKARWNEWLDPSVRKVEWSREEDEKLLHLAKLMPAQWRTVGPLVGGRTAVQCQERYERLLDEAAAAAGGGDGGEEDAVAGAIMARKLRPGDIDPHPETKPARPDPIDMDEDEIEMLQEARARLANTQGKKAKRKAREKMLDEAKRLADLQKRRELKQAGLLSSAMRTRSRGGKRSRREIDLGVEIPFHKPAPAGFHSTADEDHMADRIRAKRFRNVDFKKINEAQYKSREREAKSNQKREENRLRALERTNMQHVVAEVSRRNDPIAARKRGLLKMPEPTITDAELEKVAKLTRDQRDDSAAILATGNGGSATDALLGDYTNRPLPTPMRTPMVGTGMSSQQNITREALNMRMLERGETPLLGGENPELLSGGVGSDSILKGVATTTGAATPMIGASATPMTLSGQSNANQTPQTASGLISGPGPRDELGLNRPNSQRHTPGPTAIDGATPMRMGDDDVSISATSFATSVGDQTNNTTATMTIKQMAILERRAAKQARRDLEMALENLPAPQFEYELATMEAVTDDDDDDDGKAVVTEKDREDLEAEEMLKLRKEAEKIYEERSSVVKRLDLPRPTGSVEKELVFGYMEEDAEQELMSESERKALVLVREEMLTLLQHDAFHHPVLAAEDNAMIEKHEKQKKKGKKDKKKRNEGVSTATVAIRPPPTPTQPISPIPEEALDMAIDMLTREKEAIMQEKAMMTQGQFQSDNELKDALSNKTIQESMKGAQEQLCLETGWTTRPDSFSTEERISSIKLEYQAIHDISKVTSKCADRLESKLMVKNGGYMKRANAIEQATLQSFAELSNSKIEGEVYTMLSLHERRGMMSRIKKLEGEIEELEQIEAASQKQYGELLHEQNRLILTVKRMH